MAKIVPKDLTKGGFDITSPTDQGDAFVDSQCTIEVTVQSHGATGPFTATINTSALGTGVDVDREQLQDQGSGSYSARLSVGILSSPIGTGVNRSVSVTSGDGDTQHQSFRALFPGSGSGSCAGLGSLSGSVQVLAAARPPAIARADKPVPVALSLQAEAPSGDAESGPLDRPTTLSYSGSTADECCWLSPPVDAYSDRSAPAFWILRTGDARAWVLILRRGDSDVVVYHFTAPDEKGGAFPIRMHLAAGGHSWPRSVTVSPAL
jgi:hypothetical protein